LKALRPQELSRLFRQCPPFITTKEKNGQSIVRTNEKSGIMERIVPFLSFNWKDNV
jgi:hypothetical protein